jgi:TPR repeat protein
MAMRPARTAGMTGWLALPLLLLALLPAFAGECRARLRPLLLSATPPAEELAGIRSLCEAESRGGDPDATYQLSFFYLGLGGHFDAAAAIPLIRQAAEAGVSEAQYWLAWQSEAGPELPHDPAVALAWYEKAAGQRHRLALQRLAVAYERGELGLAPDATRALALRAQIRKCEEEEGKGAVVPRPAGYQ